MNPNLEDTIIAISTPAGPGGIGIVRISGPEALSVASKIFSAREASPADNPRTMCFGYLLDIDHKEKIDAGYICYFPAPHSYTREDVIEIHLHGSPVLLAEAVKQGIKAGARLAHPGEFTLRAYLHGRIDALQAEAINDLIRASSLDQARISFKQLEGSLSRKIGDIRAKTVELLSLLETSIEFPEEELGLGIKQIKASLSALIDSIGKLVRSYEQGRAMLEGLTIVLLGKTNVGKSTLFNALLEEERSIVTPYPGTTRDFIRENIMLDGVLMRLVDMAGYGQAQHPVEKEGITRSQKLAKNADGLLIILDFSRKETEEDFYLLDKFVDKNRIIIFNKCDLPQKINQKRILEACGGIPYVEISALKGLNLDRLKELMLKNFVPSEEKQEEIILHERQKGLLEIMLQHLNRALEMLNTGYGEELIAEEIKEILPAIGQLTGEIRAQEVIEQIFSRFCLGK